jgi:hypothetical protein
MSPVLSSLPLVLVQFPRVRLSGILLLFPGLRARILSALFRGPVGMPMQAQQSIFKDPYLYSAIVFAVVIGYLIVLFAYRYESNREYQRRTQHKVAQQRRQEDQAAIEQLGGSELAIRAFYVSPPEIRRGETAQICYDVANAKTVAITPPVGDVWPSHDRCLDISPEKTTSYTLTITGSTAPAVSQTVQLRVRRFGRSHRANYM